MQTQALTCSCRQHANMGLGQQLTGLPIALPQCSCCAAFIKAKYCLSSLCQLLLSTPQLLFIQYDILSLQHT